MMAKLPNLTPPMPAVARILSRFERDQLQGFIAVAIDLIDTMDGDCDLEHSGDEEDGQFSEDEPAAKFATISTGPGCDFSDGKEDGDEDYCLASDDRGSFGPNAHFNGYNDRVALAGDENCERWFQPAMLE